MKDLTPAFNELLQQRNASPAAKCRFSLDKIDDAFLKEAFEISLNITQLHNLLRDARQAYLSTAQPRKRHVRPGQTQAQQRYLTDKDREEIDANATAMLRQTKLAIAILEARELKRREEEARMIQKKYGSGFGALASWAAGGTKTEEHEAAEKRAQGVRIHREGVIWFLEKQLQLCGATQQMMMETRLHREMEKNRSILANAPTSSPAFSGSTAAPAPSATSVPARQSDERAPRVEPGLTSQQIQMFEKAHEDMMSQSHYQQSMEQVKTAEQSLMEISEMQAAIGNHLDTQAAYIDQLVADSFNTMDNVGGGNKQLKKAVEKPSPLARYTFYAASALSVFLVLWDLIV